MTDRTVLGRPPDASAGSVSLGDVLALEPLRGARVVAGAAGLDRRVRRVNVMEVPDILRWVKADELLLTTAYPLRDDRAALADLVPGLADRGLAGLALKPARYIETIPPEMLAAADRLAFPLVELPGDASFNEIINAVLTVILNAQAARLQRTAEIHGRFTTIVLGGGGLRQIAETLGEAIGRPVAILSAQNAIHAMVGGADWLGPVGATVPVRPGPVMQVLDGQPVVVQPIQAGPERFGSIVVQGDGQELAEDQVDAIEYAATVAALRQVQARVVAEADRRFQAICLEELVTGHVERTVLMERALAFSWDLSVPRAVMIARLDELAGRPFAELAGTSEEVGARHRLADAARAALGRTAIIWERSAEIGALAVAHPSSPSAPHPGSLAETGMRLLAEARRVIPDAIVSVGLGRVRADPLGLSESYREARRALAVGGWARGPGQVSVFDDLGVDRLLVNMPDAEQVDFAETMLGLLIAHDARHRTDLLPTLEVFLATRNAALSARRLFVHYNTVKGRLRTIEEVLGPVLDDPDRCLGLALALRIRRSPVI